ncbi:hypothetical protein FGIG_05039 [Fasciola gigantica]|uniref:CUB domain-containing protein n=1 Tax=Fasciola gigantica TaxID=46835 RepID=A0A504YW36_FASGI|nr:hypothetical protein FGIG_05039 [Fasciola gigantica]
MNVAQYVTIKIICFLLIHSDFCSRSGLPCENVFIKDHGDIITPNFTTFGEQTVACQWTLEVHKTYVVRARFILIEIETRTARCEDSYVKFFDGPTSSSTELRRMCSRNERVEVVGSTNFMFIKLVSSSTFNKINIQGRLFIGMVVQETGTYGFISPLTYPSGYESNAIYEWFIQSAREGVLQLTFEKFEILNEPQCERERLLLTDGYNTSKPLRHMLCGNKPLASYVSQYPAVHILFETDTRQTNLPGFRIKYQLVSNRKIDFTRRNTFNSSIEQTDYIHADNT